MEGGPRLLVALAWALLDSPRRPGTVRVLGWYPTCSLSPVSLWAVCVTSVCRKSGPEGFQGVAGRASSPWGDCPVPEHWPSPHQASERKEGGLHVWSSPSISPDLSLAASSLVAAATFLGPRDECLSWATANGPASLVAASRPPCLEVASGGGHLLQAGLGDSGGRTDPVLY